MDQNVFYTSNPNAPGETAVRMIRWGQLVQVIISGAFIDNWARTWLTYTMGSYAHPPLALIEIPVFDQNNNTPVLLGFVCMSNENTNVVFKNFGLITAVKGKWARGTGFYIAKQ